MSEHTIVDQDSGRLEVYTGVAGRSSRAGHRLVIAAGRWRAEIDHIGGGAEPTAVRVHVDADSLDVVSGAGGLTPLTAPERALARGNMHRSLRVADFPDITYAADTVAPTAAGYRLTGTLTIHGDRREQVLDLTVDRSDGAGAIAVEGEVTVRQTDFGIKPFSMMMGTLRVADEVRITIAATVAPG